MPEHLPRVVIVGGGFGDLAAAKALRRTSAASECKEGLMPRSVVVKAAPRTHQLVANRDLKSDGE